jgi:hypothetical protein
MARTRVSTAHRFSSAMFHAAHVHTYTHAPMQHRLAFACMHRVRAPPASFSLSARFTPLSRPTRVMSLERTRVQPQWALKRARPTRGSTQPCTTSKALPRNHLACTATTNHFAISQWSGFVAGTQNNKPSSTAKRNAAGGEATCQTRALSLPRDTVLATRFAFDWDGRGCMQHTARSVRAFSRVRGRGRSVASAIG